MSWQPVDTFAGGEDIGKTLRDLRQLQMQEKQQDISNRMNLANLSAFEAKQKNLSDLANLNTGLDTAESRSEYVTAPNQSDMFVDERVRAEKTQKFMKDRSMFEELRQMGQAEDLTAKLDARQAAAMGKAHGLGTFTYMQGKRQGMSDYDASEHARKTVTSRAGEFGVNPDDFNNTSFQSNITYEPAPDGGTFYTTLDPSTGKLSVQHLAPPKPTSGENAHNVQELISSDGKSAQKMQFNPTTKRYDIPVGGSYPAKSQVTNVNVGGPAPVAQSAFVDPSSGKPLVFDKKTGSYRVADVDGGVTPKPAAFTPESAAKAQLVEQGLTYIPKIRESLIDEKGGINRDVVAGIATRFPFTEGRKTSTLILDAVEAKLRAESGAAVPEPEVKRAAKRFVPQVADDDATIKMKIDNLEKFLSGTSDKINQGRQPAANRLIPKGGTVRYNAKGERL